MIETRHEGAAPKSLKFALYCPGYRLHTMSFDTLPGVSDRTIEPKLQPLGKVQFRGVIRGLPSRDTRVRYVDVDYTPSWICRFFGLIDCFQTRWRLTSVRLSSDGQFSAALPDFAQDAAATTFKDAGEFTFVIRDKQSGNPLFELHPSGSRSPLGSIPVAKDYPQIQTFDAEPAR